MKRTLIALILTTCLAVTAMAVTPFGGIAPSFRDYLGGLKGNAGLGLIDPSKVSFDHSVQFGVSGWGNGSMMQSLYTSTARYRLSDPLSLNVTMGLMGTRFSGAGAVTTFQDLVGGAALDYSPSKNFHMRLEISRSPGYYVLNRYTGSPNYFGNPPHLGNLDADR
jgi:hypothetical protein